ncbi:DUF6221 family protein [Streptomyces antibioticus]|uniref:DUF6221 family protein n=1 Tax=Streptomyces antibioticus TaxID=1890 RepID=UPI0033A7E92E
MQWLGAQLDEDERIARAAGGIDWLRTERPGETVAIFDSNGEPVVYDEGWPSDGQQAHIVAHDPVRVLREIEAKRRIMECHEPWVAGNGDTICGRCGREHIDGRPGGHFPCQTLRLLALPYAHRPGYRDEWRP